MWYRLEGKIPVKCTMEEAARREGESNQVVKTVDDWDGRMVSTVFLRLDHNMHRDGPPLLFETMVFTIDIPTLPPMFLVRFIKPVPSSILFLAIYIKATVLIGTKIREVPSPINDLLSATVQKSTCRLNPVKE